VYARILNAEPIARSVFAAFFHEVSMMPARLRRSFLSIGWLVCIVTSSAWSSLSSAQQSDLAERMKDPAQWPMAARDYANTRYSELDQINKSNASHMQIAWTFSVGVDRGQEAAPIIVDGTMYVVGPYAGTYPNRVFALDATSGELKWSYAPKPEPSAKGVACCDVVNRGLAFDNGKIFLNTLDNHTVAIDAKTGKELWHTKLGEINRGETITMAPGGRQRQSARRQQRRRTGSSRLGHRGR
jgi:glucose dehydrogenase